MGRRPRGILAGLVLEDEAVGDEFVDEAGDAGEVVAKVLGDIRAGDGAETADGVEDGMLAEATLLDGAVGGGLAVGEDDEVGAGGDGHVYPFIPLVAIPSTNARCAEKKTMRMGMMEIIAPAIMRGQLLAYCV
jgi:hypothetical protein